VERPHRVDRLEGEPLGLVDLPAIEEHLGEQPLALAERTSVLERLEDTDRFAQTLLRLRVVAPPAVDVRECEQDPRHPPRRTRLGEELAGLLAELLGLVQLALQL